MEYQRGLTNFARALHVPGNLVIYLIFDHEHMPV